MTKPRTPTSTSIKQFRRVGARAYWAKRAQRERWRSSVASRLERIDHARDQKARDARALPSLVRTTTLRTLGTLLLFGLVELGARELTHFHLTIGQRVNVRLDSPSYDTLVSAVIGAEVFFLAMFYTTLGVVASTAYSDVPGEIRALFIRARSSQSFIRSTVRGIVWGLAIFACGLMTYKPHALTVVVLVGLTLVSIANLIWIGAQLFSFFDLTELSKDLPRDFSRSAAMVCVRQDKVPTAGQQIRGHNGAARVIRIYAELAALLRARGESEQRAHREVILRIVGVLVDYLQRKPSIPTKSRWFRPTPVHRNWLTLDHHRLSLALDTSTGVRADLEPDPLWVESEMAERIHELLPSVLSAPEQGEAIQVIDQMISLTQLLSSRLEIDAALLIRAAVVDRLKDAIRTSAGAGPGNTAYSSERTPYLFRLSCGERSVLFLTSILLGVASCAQRFGEISLTVWDRAVDRPTGPYNSGLPREVLVDLEQIAAGIDLERRIEGRRITPDWWVGHFCSKSLATALTRAVELLWQEVTGPLVGEIEAITDGADCELGLATAFPALELLSKLRTHLPTVTRSLEHLEGFRNEHTNSEIWPETPGFDMDIVANLERRLHLYLARTAVNSGLRNHDPSRPDYHGQAYKVLYDAIFHYLLGGDVSTARQLLRPVLYLAEHARFRLQTDLQGQPNQAKFIFGTEPMIDMIELGGYALLMESLDGAGIWTDVQEVWRTMLKPDGPLDPTAILDLLAARDSTFALTQGGMERSERLRRFRRLLHGRGIWISAYWYPGADEASPAHPSPLVRLFARDGAGGLPWDVEDVFALEYLVPRVTDDDFELPYRLSQLRQQLELDADRFAPPTSAEGEAPAAEEDYDEGDSDA